MKVIFVADIEERIANEQIEDLFTRLYALLLLRKKEHTLYTDILIGMG